MCLFEFRNASAALHRCLEGSRQSSMQKAASLNRANRRDQFPAVAAPTQHLPPSRKALSFADQACARQQIEISAQVIPLDGSVA